MKKPENEDYISIPYECENEDIIEIYWVQRSGPLFIAGPDPLERAYDHESSLY